MGNRQPHSLRPATGTEPDPAPAVLDWLLEGDPAIRWQVLRDLLDAPAAEVRRARRRVAEEGWGRRLLDLQAPGGRWSEDRGPRDFRGLYIPKWTSTAYTLLLLRHLGLPSRHPQALAGCRELVEGAEWFPSGGLGYFGSRRIAEHCVSGMVLAVLEAFGYAAAPRDRLTAFLLAEQCDDGGWNCEVEATHSSFNTTLIALEALQFRSPSAVIDAALAQGREFFLRHHLYHSHRTGQIVRPAFTRFPPPLGWHFDALRGLEHFAAAAAPRDPRLEDAVALVRRRRRKDGRWVAAAPPAGAVHFRLEEPRTPSRWTTLRCLRVLRWWEAAPVS